MLHQIGGAQKSEFNVSAKYFKLLADWLTGCQVAKAANATDCPAGSVILTFDDVHDGVYNIAYPLLCERNIPFTLFVSLSLLDQPGYINTAQLKEMAANPLCTIGSHGIDHTFFRNLDDASFRRQLSLSADKLEKITGARPELFAFPYGSVFQCGFTGKKRVADYYRFGFGTISKPVTLIDRDYFLPRINLTEEKILNLTGSR